MSCIPSILSPLLSVKKSSPLPYMLNKCRESLESLYNIRSAAMERIPAEGIMVLYYAAVNESRISEILDIKNSDYIGNNRWYIRSKKGSEPYVGLLEEQEPGTDKDGQVDPSGRLFTLNYGRLYGWLVRAGWYSRKSGCKNLQRTHGHRTVTAKIIHTFGGNAAAKPILHHRSIRSTAIYTEKET